MVKNLILSGGSMKGLAYIGMIKCIEEYNIVKSIDNYVGTSIGACVCFCLLIGYTYEELYDVFINLDINKARNIQIDNILNFGNTYGVDNGDKIVKILKVFLKKKLQVNSISFNELYEKTHKNITIIGSCLNTTSVEYFNLKNSPNMDVIDALRISISIPLFFTPVIYENKYYVDGALTNNYPIDICVNNNKETLGIVLTSNTYKYTEINSIDNYLISIINTNFVHQDKEKIKKYYDVTIDLEIECNSFDFSLSTEIKMDIINQGYLITKEQIKKKYNYLLDTPKLLLKE
jgi:predicted acylesterase/phospholipase RssA